MKYYLYVAIGIALLGLIATGCDLSTAEDDTVTLSGRVVNAATNDPIQDAVITATFTNASDEDEEITTVTDAEGTFSFDVSVDGPVDVTITASKGGFSIQRTERVARELESVTDINLELSMGSEEEEQEPGRPTNIILSNQSDQVIRVKESGGTDISRLTFQVVDSTGRPIAVDQAVEVDFRLGQAPGDVSITPESVETDGQGEATVNVSSGTTSGVVQVVAETEAADGSTIRSKPVQITIHGGLPNQCHFSLAPEQFNFPGLTRFGVTNPVSVIVGDKYGNPVVPSSSVYFTTNAGVIGGSVETDGEGRGSVNLTSARPLPDGGVATIRAETAGTDAENTLVDPSNCVDATREGNELIIFDEIPVLFSGRTEVQVSPAEAQLGQTYALTVWDVENNNPLAPGTSINVQAQGTKVKAVGNTEVTLDDTAILNDKPFGPEDVIKGDGITQFTFRVVEDQEVDETGEPTVEAVTITIDSPNGSFEIVLTPPGGASSAAKSKSTVRATNDATVEQQADQVVVRAPERE